MQTDKIIKCFTCGTELIKHPRADEHPYPENSFICTTCPKHNEFTCCSEEDCDDTMIDWWWSMHEIYEKVYEADGGLFCQYHYFENHYDSDDSDF